MHGDRKNYVNIATSFNRRGTNKHVERIHSSAALIERRGLENRVCICVRTNEITVSRKVLSISVQSRKREEQYNVQTIKPEVMNKANSQEKPMYTTTTVFAKCTFSGARYKQLPPRKCSILFNFNFKTPAR